jgi:hypothetical protein
MQRMLKLFEGLTQSFEKLEKKIFCFGNNHHTKREDGEKQQREEGRGKNQNQRK